MEKSGFEIDTVCTNMVLSTYGTHGEHMEMVSWLQRMRSLGHSILNQNLQFCLKLLSNDYENGGGVE